MNEWKKQMSRYFLRTIPVFQVCDNNVLHIVGGLYSGNLFSYRLGDKLSEIKVLSVLVSSAAFSPGL